MWNEPNFAEFHFRCQAYLHHKATWKKTFRVSEWVQTILMSISQKCLFLLCSLRSHKCARIRRSYACCKTSYGMFTTLPSTPFNVRNVTWERHHFEGEGNLDGIWGNNWDELVRRSWCLTGDGYFSAPKGDKVITFWKQSIKVTSLMVAIPPWMWDVWEQSFSTSALDPSSILKIYNVFTLRRRRTPVLTKYYFNYSFLCDSFQNCPVRMLWKNVMRPSLP